MNTSLLSRYVLLLKKLKQPVAFLELSEFLNRQAQPERVLTLISTSKHNNFLNKVRELTEKVIHEIEFSGFHLFDNIQVIITEKWKLLFRLMDLIDGYLQQQAPPLRDVYKNILQSLLNTHQVFYTLFGHLHPSDCKLPDVLLRPAISNIGEEYKKILVRHPHNVLLKILLHPLRQIIYHPHKGNNTNEKIRYASTLLENVRRWSKKGGATEQLYSIALAMNHNCPMFLGFIFKHADKQLDDCVTGTQKEKALQEIHRRYREARLYPRWKRPATKGYDVTTNTIEANIDTWLSIQQEVIDFQLAEDKEGEEVPKEERVIIKGDSRLFSWWLKITVMAGFFATDKVAPILRIIATVITVSTGTPNIGYLIDVAKSGEIPLDIYEQLVEHFENCIAILHKMKRRDNRKKRTPNRNGFSEYILFTAVCCNGLC